MVSRSCSRVHLTNTCVQAYSRTNCLNTLRAHTKKQAAMSRGDIKTLERPDGTLPEVTYDKMTTLLQEGKVPTACGKQLEFVEIQQRSAADPKGLTGRHSKK